VLKKADKTTYTGQFHYGERHGQGKLQLRNGDIYTGSFHQNWYHGQGDLTQPRLKRHYVGSFKKGLFEGDGKLQEEDFFTYKGQFSAGKFAGQGIGKDTRSGLEYIGEWVESRPKYKSHALDLIEISSDESYLPNAQLLREEASNQLNVVVVPEGKKGKDKGDKGKKVPDSKKPTAVIEEPLPPTIVGPDLTLTAGEELPEVIMRFVDAEDNAVSQESGRTYKITMYRERKLPAEDMAEAEIIRQPILWRSAPDLCGSF